MMGQCSMAEPSQLKYKWELKCKVRAWTAEWVPADRVMQEVKTEEILAIIQKYVTDLEICF